MRKKQQLRTTALVVLAIWLLSGCSSAQQAANQQGQEPTDRTGFAAVNGRGVSGDGWFHRQFAYDG